MPVPLFTEIIEGAGCIFTLSRYSEKISVYNINNVQNGDVIKVNRGFYDHYGIFIKKNSHVIHYTGTSDFNGIVRETLLTDFLNGAENFDICHFPEKLEQLTNYHQNKNPILDSWEFIKTMKIKNYHLYSGDETVSRAKGQLGNNQYNILFNNCEHFNNLIEMIINFFH